MCNGGEPTEELTSAMITILHSHRFKKGENFADGIDFSKVRNVLYSYSSEAKTEFMADRVLATLFSHFMEKGSREFIESKVHSKPNLYVCELEDELKHMNAEAATTLSMTTQ